MLQEDKTCDAEAPLLSNNNYTTTTTSDYDCGEGNVDEGGSHGPELRIDSVFGHDVSMENDNAHKQIITPKRVILLSILLFLLIMIPVTLLSIIPSEVTTECKETKIVILEAHISNPTNDGFDSTVLMHFTKGSPIPATIHMHESYINWNGNGDGDEGGKMVKLTHSHQLDASTKEQKLTSKASVNDLDAFTRFNEYSITAGLLIWEMMGAATVNAIVDVDVDLDKTVEMSGYNSFSIPPIVQDVMVTGGTVTSLLTVSNTVITSQSNMALSFGQDLHFLIKSRGVTIGIGTIPDAILSIGEFSTTSHVAMSSKSEEEYNELMIVLGQVRNYLNIFKEITDII
jgi:hypothetical protein